MQPIGKPWRGVVASVVLSGAGQFFSGAKVRGVIWFLLSFIGPLATLVVINLPAFPAKLWPVLLIWFPIWIVMLFDSRRSIAALRWWGWLLLILGSVAVSEASSAIAHSLFRSFHIPTEGMEPTLQRGDDLMVSRYVYWFRQPSGGDIIVFGTSQIPMIRQDPAGREVMYVKRLIGLPGDLVEIGDRDIRVNGEAMQFGDPSSPVRYIPHQSAISRQDNFGYERYSVPADRYFVLGDNSGHSFDSRYWGTIPRSSIYGKVTKIYWPFSRASTPR